MTGMQEPRRNVGGDLCPPWCSTSHTDLMPVHMGQQRAIQPGTGGNRIVAAAARDSGPHGDPSPYVGLIGNLCQGPFGVARIPHHEAADLAVIVEALACASAEQHMDLAEAIRAVAAEIEAAEPEAGS